ncbi:Heptahelical transmembrane protein 4 [Hibiscus syriacus]|uniref:Heptahelical transmembrane protein 4 n=1 Tax=Hibiscus syriacus TaxID=106335 RepID=A0A6A2ZZB9_HIBSY|nr:Heptahelical transmembrane protein 4 [Hibiscus syriacus]
MKVPKVVDLEALQQISDALKKADLHKLQSDILTSFLFQKSIDSQVLQGMREPITRWPFFRLLGGAMFCLLASSTCHSFRATLNAYRISAQSDYGIAALIATSFYPPVYYSFMCDPFFCNLYLGSITSLGITTILFSLLPMFQRPEFRKIRASLFFGMGMSGVAPILHKLILFWQQPEALTQPWFQSGALYEILMGVLYGVGALVYAARVPAVDAWEIRHCWQQPPTFHVLVVAGAVTHYQAGLVYLGGQKWMLKEQILDKPMAKEHYSTLLWSYF